MPPKKKKEKLTKAQRALKKLEASRQLRRDHLEREIQHGVLNWKILQKKWRQLLILQRLPEFWQDVKVMWHRFDNVVDLKDYTLSFVMDELDEGEVQHFVNLRAHVEAIDKLIEFFGQRLDELHSDHLRDVDEVTTTAAATAAEVDATQDADETYLKEICYIMEQNMATSDANANMVYLSTTDEETIKYSDAIQLLRSTLERQMELMWQRFKAVLSEYYASTEDRRRLYLEFKARDEANIVTVNAQLLRTQKLFTAISKSKEALAGAKEARVSALSDLHFEQSIFSTAYNNLRARLKAEQELDSNQLIILTSESDDAIKFMRKIATKGERLLKLAAICRKMETQAEKVTPFPTDCNEDEDEVYTIKIDASDSLLKLHDDFADLSHFWLRVGEADTKRCILRAQLQDLRREHEDLCRRLRCYLSGGLEQLPRAQPAAQQRSVSGVAAAQAYSSRGQLR